jgi:hypothetical protein
MNFHVQTPDGVVRPVEFPTDQPVGVLLRELVTDDSLKIHPAKPEAWHLLHESGEQKLDLSKNLEQNAVSRGERLQLKAAKEPVVIASSEPAVQGKDMMKRCDNGHYYDPKKHAAGCPYCGTGIEIPGPRSIRIGSPVPTSEGDARTRPYGQKTPSTSGVGDDAPTRVLSPGGTTAIDPVVGWLVNAHGLEKGLDYRIRSENNTIGRSKDMYISISGDESISRERHAVITFDPQQNSFHLSPGEGRGLVYVNGEVLLAHRKLQPYDRIQLGKTKLIFVPFCGDKFTWGKDDES